MDGRSLSCRGHARGSTCLAHLLKRGLLASRMGPTEEALRDDQSAPGTRTQLPQRRNRGCARKGFARAKEQPPFPEVSISAGSWVRVCGSAEYSFK